ncbi:13110_t:CDS:2 [Acaulospora colombiana]|uniref:13110_t:CDS:1 n=1 Tax=Acaulospora colombiana TaxID=27376 RepID=A0ACA9NG06_9GLOM|nr:13110_t:CDS:2 [Acaulospora colombiana]
MAPLVDSLGHLPESIEPMGSTKSANDADEEVRCYIHITASSSSNSRGCTFLYAWGELSEILGEDVRRAAAKKVAQDLNIVVLAIVLVRECYSVSQERDMVCHPFHGTFSPTSVSPVSTALRTDVGTTSALETRGFHKA